LLIINCKTGVATEVEIKISVSDLKADFKKAHKHESKRIKYLYYAIPLTMLSSAIELLDERVGIITVERVDETKWMPSFLRSETKRRPKRNMDYHWSESEILNVTRLGCMRLWALKQLVVNKQKEIIEIKNGSKLI